MKTITFDKKKMEIVLTYPHCINRVKCNVNHDWSMFKDGEVLKEKADFEIQECNFTYNADLVLSQYLAVPFRDYYKQLKNQPRKGS